MIQPSRADTKTLLDLAELESAAALVHRVMAPTPVFAWPKLKNRLGCEVFVKHENHTPTGAFKVRGGIVYLDRLSRAQPQVLGVISATRGNHGQSIAFAAARAILRDFAASNARNSRPGAAGQRRKASRRRASTCMIGKMPVSRK